MPRAQQGWPRLAGALVLLAAVVPLPFVDGLLVSGTAPCAAPPFAGPRKLIVQPNDSIPGPNAVPDCIYMPSPPKVIEAVLKLASVQPGEVLFDLGAGDGRICIAAAKQYRARAYGYEIDADLIKKALENVKKHKVQHLVTIERRDIFTLDLSGADVVTLWLLPALNVRLIPQLEKMKPGSRIVSIDFDMMDVVKPDKTIEEVSSGVFWSSFFVPRYEFKPNLYLWKTPLKKNDKLYREFYERYREFYDLPRRKGH